MNRFVVSVLVSLFTLAGLWLCGALLSNDFVATQVLLGAWVVSVGVALFLATRTRRHLRAPALVSFGVTAALSLGTLGALASREVEVREPLSADPHPLAAGPFVAMAHSGRGTAAISQREDGSRRVVISDLATEAGPDLMLVLTEAAPDPDANLLPAHLDLGPLKGNRGTFEYVLPPGVDVGRYSHAVVWCRLFSVPFTVAALRPL